LAETKQSSGESNKGAVAVEVTTVAVVPIRCRRSTRLPQWLLIGAIALGLIGMHHMHADPTPTHGPATNAAARSTAPGSVDGGVVFAAFALTPRSTLVAAAEAVVSAGESCSCMGHIEHLCHAVLGAAAPISAAIGAAVIADNGAPLALAVMGEVSPLQARAPPRSGVRLAQFGVWRR
jgi:hypothetical protein